jgi:gas vesicle protein
MNDRDKADLWTAVAIGAVVGIGAALLLRAEDEPRTRRLLRGLEPLQKRAGHAMRNARKGLSRHAAELGDAGEDLLHDGTRSLKALRKDAAKIVAEARRELEEMATSGMKQARRGAKRTRRRFV